MNETSCKRDKLLELACGLGIVSSSSIELGGRMCARFDKR